MSARARACARRARRARVHAVHVCTPRRARPTPPCVHHLVSVIQTCNLRSPSLSRACSPGSHPNQVSSFAGGFLLLWVGGVVLAGAALLCQLFVQETGLLACAGEWLPRGLLRSRKQTLHSAKMV